MGERRKRRKKKGRNKRNCEVCRSVSNELSQSLKWFGLHQNEWRPKQLPSWVGNGGKGEEEKGNKESYEEGKVIIIPGSL
jgi:hypothetical protein